MALHIRPFEQSNAEYAAVVAINNAFWQDDPTSIDAMRQSDAGRNPRHFSLRLVGEDAGEIRVIGECGETFWLDEPGQYFWHVNLRPEHRDRGYLEAMHTALMEHLAVLSPTHFYVGMRDDKEFQVRFIMALGYQPVQTDPTSTLDVGAFEPARFAPLLEQIRERGIVLTNLVHLQEIDPDWAQRLWNLQWETRQDIPASGPIKREPFEDFLTRIANRDQHDASMHYVAVSKRFAEDPGSVYLGMTRLSTNKVDPSIGHTHLTGVVRAARRQGIATALKVHAITDAKARGVRRIDTMNNEVNPMLNLNIRLGFQPGPAWCYYVKDLQSDNANNQ